MIANVPLKQCKMKHSFEKRWVFIKKNPTKKEILFQLNWLIPIVLRECIALALLASPHNVKRVCPPTKEASQLAWIRERRKRKRLPALLSVGVFRDLGVSKRSTPGLWGGGVKLENLWNKKKPKSTLLADNKQGLITTKQTKPKPVASRAPHSITPAGDGGKQWIFRIWILAESYRMSM